MQSLYATYTHEEEKSCILLNDEIIIDYKWKGWYNEDISGGFPQGRP